MKLHLNRRKYRILTLIAVAGTIYLCFQLLSFKVLNFSGKTELKYGSKHSAQLLDDFPVERDIVNVKDNSDVNMVQNHKENINKTLKYVRGIHISQVEIYTADSDGNFLCLHSQVG